MHIGVDMSEFVQKAPFDLILLFEKIYWDCTPEECLTATSIRPCLHPFFPFSPLPPPQSPLQDTSLYQSKRANPEAKPAFNLGLIVKASNLQPVCVISFCCCFSFN